MNVVLAAIADYSMTAKDDKLSIIGMFERISAQQFPATHARMDLVLRMQCTKADINRSREILVELVDEDGHNIAKVEGHAQVGDFAETVATITNVIVFQGLVFEKPGTYQFNIFIEGRQECALPLILELAKTPIS